MGEAVGQGALAVGGAAVACWLALVAALAVGARGTGTPPLREAVRLLPDLVVLLRRLAADRTLPRGVRLLLLLALGYLLLPLDLVPDVVPVLGWLDDVVVVALVVRRVVRRAGPATLRRHWPGTAAGLAGVQRLAGLPVGRSG